METVEIGAIGNGVFALLGATVAFLASYLTSKRAEKAAAQRMWAEKINELSIDMLNKMNIFSEPNPYNNGDRNKFDSLAEKMTAACDYFESKMTEISIYCSSKTRTSAVEYSKACKVALELAEDAKRTNATQNSAIETARGEFIANVRKDMNVPSA